MERLENFKYCLIFFSLLAEEIYVDALSLLFESLGSSELTWKLGNGRLQNFGGV